MNDGAVFISAGWLGDAWHLYFNQIPGRAVSVLTLFGPAWAARAILGLDASTYMTVAHTLYFAVPLVLWLVLRAVERDRLFSRLYLAIALVLMYFPSELIVGIGLWLIWLALVCDPARSTRGVGLTTLLLGAAMAFTHPALALMSLLYVAFGPGSRSPVASRCRSALCLRPPRCRCSCWQFISRLAGGCRRPTRRRRGSGDGQPCLHQSHLDAKDARPLSHAGGLVVPVARPRRRHAGRALGAFCNPPRLSLAVLGLWCAAAGTGLMTWIYARHTAVYVLVMALLLALPAPVEWMRRAERPLMLFAAICAMAAISYNVDLFLFGRFVDRNLAPGVIDAAAAPAPWPSKRPEAHAARILFKFAAGEEYVRDVVMPTYDWFRVTLAFYSFFRSDRQSVLFHPLGGGADWLPFTCLSIAESLDHARDAQDRMFLTFLSEHYCAS